MINSDTVKQQFLIHIPNLCVCIGTAMRTGLRDNDNTVVAQVY